MNNSPLGMHTIRSIGRRGGGYSSLSAAQLEIVGRRVGAETSSADGDSSRSGGGDGGAIITAAPVLHMSLTRGRGASYGPVHAKSAMVTRSGGCNEKDEDNGDASEGYNYGDYGSDDVEAGGTAPGAAAARAAIVATATTTVKSPVTIMKRRARSLGGSGSGSGRRSGRLRWADGYATAHVTAQVWPRAAHHHHHQHS